MVSHNTSRQTGFTLVEVMAALGILVFGLTTLMGTLFNAAGEHRGSDMRVRSTHMIDTIVNDIIEDHMAAHSDLEEPLPDIRGEDLPGYEGIRHVVVFVADPKDPALVQARVNIAWKEQGENVGIDYHRILVRQVPFSRRVRMAREKQDS